MEGFNYCNPVRVVFGEGVVSQAGAEASQLGKTALLVSYEEHDLLSSTLETVQASIEKEGMRVVPFYEVEPNPEIATVGRGVELCRSSGADVVVGVGGGSA